MPKISDYALDSDIDGTERVISSQGGVTKAIEVQSIANFATQNMSWPIYGSVAGTLAAQTGSMRWYPTGNVTLISVNASVGTAPTIDLILDIKKNGVSLFEINSRPTILAGANQSTPLVLNTTLTTTDYLTTDIISGNGSDLMMRIDYIRRITQ